VITYEAPKNYKEVLKMMEVEFINQEDPLLAMLEWLPHQLMQVEEVDFFRNHPIDRKYPFLWIDALYEKVREDGRVISIALMIAYGINRE